MNRFVLKNTFIKIYISLFNKYFYKNKQSKLCFEDCVAVLNIIYFLYRGSINIIPIDDPAWKHLKLEHNIATSSTKGSKCLTSYIFHFKCRKTIKANQSAI